MTVILDFNKFFIKNSDGELFTDKFQVAEENKKLLGLIKENTRNGISEKPVEIKNEDGFSMKLVSFNGSEGIENPPVLFYFHGGAFMFAPFPFNYEAARLYAKNNNCRVLMPVMYVGEKGFDSDFTFLKKIVQMEKELNFSLGNSVFISDSSGSFMLLSILLYMRERGLAMPKAQIHIYPCLNYKKTEDSDGNSIITKETAPAMWNHLFCGLTGENRQYLPLENNLEGLPPAYIEASENDYLFSDSLLLERKLKDSGVSTELNIIKGADHCFDWNMKSEKSKEAFIRRNRFIKKSLNK